LTVNPLVSLIFLNVSFSLSALCKIEMDKSGGLWET
jgi:hypothetical protein